MGEVRSDLSVARASDATRVFGSGRVEGFNTRRETVLDRALPDSRVFFVLGCLIRATTGGSTKAVSAACRGPGTVVEFNSASCRGSRMTNVVRLASG